MRERKTLDRVLSRAGAMSRKQAELAIRDGRVRVNGLRERDPAAWVDLGQDRVTLDDAPLEAWKPLYFALHKPVGFVTTRSDEHGRATVYELTKSVSAWIAPVGRLDRDTSGLLLFTNDTDLAERITNPASELRKTYECVTAGMLSEDALERLRTGVDLNDGPTRPAEVRELGRDADRTRIEITLHEGRNRQIRRMLEAVGSRVLALHRISVGPVRLGELAEGALRPLTSREVRALGSER
jgi:pseudouridine synthase